MKLALCDGSRVAQVVAIGQQFPVAAPLQWRDCADDVTPETHFFDGTTFALKSAPAQLPAIDLSDVDNLERTLKAIALVMRDYCNQLKAGSYSGSGAGGSKTIAEVKADFKVKYDSL